MQVADPGPIIRDYFEFVSCITRPSNPVSGSIWVAELTKVYSGKTLSESAEECVIYVYQNNSLHISTLLMHDIRIFHLICKMKIE